MLSAGVESCLLASSQLQQWGKNTESQQEFY